MKTYVTAIAAVAIVGLLAKPARANSPNCCSNGDEKGWWNVTAGNGNGNVNFVGAGLAGDNTFVVVACGETSSGLVFCNDAVPFIVSGIGWGFETTPVNVGCGFASYFEYVADLTTQRYVYLRNGTGGLDFETISPGC
jgi:hypothetical protein